MKHKSKPIYLDYNATTPIGPEVLEERGELVLRAP